MIKKIHHFISLTLAEPPSLKKQKKSLLFIQYLITKPDPPKLVHCDVLVKKESRKFQDFENFHRVDCSLGFKDVFCKISRNYIYKQRNSAELKKLSRDHVERFEHER